VSSSVKTILVTGGAGYIGSHTVKELMDLGYEVVVFDNLSEGHRKAILTDKFVQGDLLNDADINAVFEKFSIYAVFHFAASCAVGESMKDPQKYVRQNITASINLANAMVKHDVKKLIFSSTAAVFGEPEKVPITESNNMDPTNTYGDTKLMFEKILKWYDYAYGIKFVALRYFNAAGAHESAKIGEDHKPETHIIPIVLQVALGQRDKVSIFGNDYPTKDGTCVRDYIHVTDLAQAHIIGLKKLETGVSAKYNLGNGNGFSVKEIVNIAQDVTGRKIPVEYSPRREGDPAVLIAGADKIKKELGWNPRFGDVRKVLETAWAWHKQHPKGYED